jgi:hypothetical protein
VNKRSYPCSPCVSICAIFYFSFVLVFSGTEEYPLNYRPDFEREANLQKLYATLERKITFFSLPEKEIKNLAAAGTDIELCCIVGFDTETLNGLQPEEIYNFCLAIEEKYSPNLTHIEAWQSKNSNSITFDRAEPMLGLIAALAKNYGNEFAPSLDVAGLRPCFSHIIKPENGGAFTQSWMLRLVLQLIQPFKNYPLSYPALVQSVFLKNKNYTLKNLLHLNLETLNHKKAFADLLEPYYGLRASELRTIDLTPALELGYNITEESLNRIDGLLRQQYRQTVGYAKRDPRMRNLLNFLFDKGIDGLAPHIEEFNERQQQIVKYLFAKRYLGTKELTLDFKCDRKTIQRDFAKLLSTEVVRSTGNGSALKYCINLKTNGYDLLEIHSTPVRRKDEYQENLFGEEIWETKKA